MPARLRGRTKLLAKVSEEGEEEDLFDGEWMSSVAVELSSSLGLSDMDPVGRAVAGSAEPILFDEGFQKDGRIAIAGLPILRELLGEAGEDPGGEVGGEDPGEDEETSVVGDSVKISGSSGNLGDKK